MMLPLSLVTPWGRKPRETDALQPLRATEQVSPRHVSSSARRCGRAEVPSCPGKVGLSVVSDQPTAKHYYGVAPNWATNSCLLCVLRPARRSSRGGARHGDGTNASSEGHTGACPGRWEGRDRLDGAGQGVAVSLRGDHDGTAACATCRSPRPTHRRFMATTHATRRGRERGEPSGTDSCSPAGTLGGGLPSGRGTTPSWRRGGAPASRPAGRCKLADAPAARTTLMAALDAGWADPRRLY